MKRAVLCVPNPWDYIPQLTDYSIMIINPESADSRNQYLLTKSDYSLLITESGIQERAGADYPNERVLWYTSGTTGDSKFCSFTQEQIDILAAKICRTYDITANDRYVSIMSLWHAHGQGFYWATRMAGCETHFLPVRDIRHMSAYNPTFITAVPDVLKTIAKFDFDNLRFIRGASARLPDQLYTQLKEKFCVPVIEAFGMTEALSHCFTNPLHGEQRMGTVGLPDGIEANIVDGQLYIKGPTLFTAEWYNTGDIAMQDDQGYYKILGRHRDQINVKGKKLNPVSLETQLLNNVTGLNECVVFGADSVKCLYVGTCEAEDIRRYLIGLGVHCRPTLLQSVDVIPVSPSGKVSRSWLDSVYSDK
jgi:acyl-coenzyme A synthetase/AMP-(fatty) acid ligase